MTSRKTSQQAERFVEIKALAEAVERLHKAKALFVRSVEVDESFQGQTVWKGLVSIFELEGHADSKLCYAWSEPIEDSAKRRYVAVLHKPPIDTPLKAVQASMVAAKNRQ